MRAVYRPQRASFTKWIMKTSIDGALWPLPMVLGLWLFLMVQVVNIWLLPHQPNTLVEQCARLQLASAPRAGHAR